MSTLELKEVYIQSASLLDNWESLSRNECANKYLEYKDTNSNLANSYLSALILKFWNILTRNLYTIQVANEYDCHDILIDGIMKALKAHVWTNPDNVLYNDSNGPEKAINVCLFSTKLNFFGASNRQKRRLNYANYSLEKLEEDSSDGYYVPYFDSDDVGETYLDRKVIELFNKEEYLAAFMLDALLTFVFFDIEDDEYVFNKKKFKHHLKFIDDSYLKVFTQNYNLDYNKVKHAYESVSVLLADNIDALVDNVFDDFRQDKEFIKQLGADNVNRFAIPVKLW